MPERRARMLDVEPIPVVSVPVVAPNTWLKETPPVQPEADPAKLRFLSETEDDGPSQSAPQQRVQLQAWPPHEASYAQSAAAVAEATPVAFETLPEHSTPSRPRFADLPDARTLASYTPLPRDYAAEMHASDTGDRTTVAAAPVFSQPSETEHPDLDIPAFLRRGQF
jgi:hypothetical protein